MAVDTQHRDYVTYDELLKRWQCSENDLNFLIISRDLRPSIKLIGKHPFVRWQKTRTSQWYGAKIVPNDADYLFEVSTTDWLYLQDPLQCAPFDCQFRFVSEDRDPDKKAEYPIPIWRQLPEPVAIEYIKTNAVFLLKEIALYEETTNRNLSAVEEMDAPLSTRERNSLLAIIAVLCKESRLDYNKPAKTAAIILSTAATMGVSIGETTIEKHLKLIPLALMGKTK